MRHFWILCAPFVLFSPALTQAAPATSTLGDPQILAIVRASNQAEVEAAKVAQSKTKNPAVKEFAQHMITAHKQADQDAKALASSAKIKLQENAESDLVERSAKDTLAQLKKLKGSEFDQAYVAQQIAMHETVLKDIDDKLLPKAQREATQTFLKRIRPVVDQHLQHAKQLKDNLDESAAAGGNNS